MKPAKHQRSKQRANKDAKIYVRSSTTVHNLLFCTHSLCMITFLLLSSSVRSKQLLCFVYGQGQKREQKLTTKNFVEFHNHHPLLYNRPSPSLNFSHLLLSLSLETLREEEAAEIQATPPLKRKIRGGAAVHRLKVAVG